MERYTLTVLDTEYWKVDIQYLQKSQLLVMAKTADEAMEMVKKNIADGTELFEATAAVKLTDEEKEWALKNMNPDPAPENTEAETSYRKTVN